MFDFDSRWRCFDDTDISTTLRKWSDLMISGAEKLGKNVTDAPNYKRYFQEVGFVDVVEKKFQWPMNPWPKGKYYKTLGRGYNQDLHEGLEGITMAIFTRAHGMKKEEVQEMVMEVRRNIDDKNLHNYLAM
jgi:hypothetical protein